MIFIKDFIGSGFPNKILEFYGSDSEEVFLENLKTKDENWYYRNKSITYKFNDLGHRCKSIEEIDLNNYILFVGCSNTEGVGVELEKTFPYMVSHELKCDYYNLALGGSGIDVVEHNLLTWFSKIKQKPKWVILQYPGYVRFAAKVTGYNSLIPCGTWTETKFAKRFIASADESGYFLARGHISSQLIQQVIDVPLLKINFGGIKEYDYGITYRKLDHARDFSHAGINSHSRLTDLILEQIR